MSYLITADVYVTIGGVPLHTPAWTTRDPLVLFQGASTRGSDRIIPGAAGVRPYKRRATVTQRTLLMIVYGHKQPDGTENADQVAGLIENLRHLREHVADPTGIGDGTLTAELHLPDTSTVSGAVHVERFEWENMAPGAAAATLDLSIVGGSLS